MKQYFFRHLSLTTLIVFPAALFAQSSFKTKFSSIDLANSYKFYLSIYNESPVAANDYITGNSTRTVNGNVLTNDHHPQSKNLTTYLVAGSADGEVSLAANGDFTFIPNNSFNGTSTTFSYKACDEDLCSETATVTLNFPPATITSIVLTDLTATVNDENEVIINWATNFENNNDRFEIERSTDGVHFTTIGSVKGQGTTNLLHNYSFTNKVSRHTAGKNDLYYRLKQVTTNNETSVYKPLVVRIYKTKTLELLSVTPNPAVNDIKVTAQLNEPAYVVMKVMSNNGTEVLRKAIKSQQGINHYTLDGSSRLEKGMYFMEMIINSNERMMIKLMKD